MIDSSQGLERPQHVSLAREPKSNAVIAPGRHMLPAAVRAGGWPVTQFEARGDEEENLDVINIAIDGRHLPDLEQLVDSISPDAVWIIERVHRGRGLAVPATSVAPSESFR